MANGFHAIDLRRNSVSLLYWADRSILITKMANSHILKPLILPNTRYMPGRNEHINARVASEQIGSILFAFLCISTDNNMKKRKKKWKSLEFAGYIEWNYTYVVCMSVLQTGGRQHPQHHAWWRNSVGILLYLYVCFCFILLPSRFERFKRKFTNEWACSGRRRRRWQCISHRQRGSNRRAGPARVKWHSICFIS